MKNKHYSSNTVIAGYYRELSFNNKIFTKGILYAQLICKNPRDSYLYFLKKYATKNQKGAWKQIERQLNKKYRNIPKK